MKQHLEDRETLGENGEVPTSQGKVQREMANLLGSLNVNVDCVQNMFTISFLS